MSNRLILKPALGYRPWKIVFEEDFRILAYSYTQNFGYAVAISWLENNGGGEIIVLDENENFQKKDTISPRITPMLITGIKPKDPFEEH